MFIKRLNLWVPASHRCHHLRSHHGHRRSKLTRVNRTGVPQPTVGNYIRPGMRSTGPTSMHFARSHGPSIQPVLLPAVFKRSGPFGLASNYDHAPFFASNSTHQQSAGPTPSVLAPIRASHVTIRHSDQHRRIAGPARRHLDANSFSGHPLCNFDDLHDLNALAHLPS